MLKLQKVELFGFKSFAESTAITFQGSGITAIVGPNGCGKSNISDAIHWVLGEQSARTLRSGKMQDVLFNGTSARKSTGLAEVKLTLLDQEVRDMMESAPDLAHGGGEGEIANGNGTAAAKVLNGGLITVARRLFSSGESDYLMNERPCRLRDIQELFLGTGLGPDSYAIIEQGRIGQILSAKPHERRALIEEAAGITRFKAKRKLAWAKLESSKQNLARVNDILEEVTRQLNSLRRQAAKARRYKELYEQVRTELRTILANRYGQKEEEATRVALELGMLRRSVQERAEQIEEQEKLQQTAHREQELRDEEQREAAEQRSTLRLEAERARGLISSNEKQAEYLGRRLEEAGEEDDQLQGRSEAMETERAGAAGVLATVEEEKDGLTEKLRGWESRSRQCRLKLEETERRLEQLRGGMLETVGECATLRNQAGQLERYIEQNERQMAQAEAQIREMESVRTAATARQKDTGVLHSEQDQKRRLLVARQAELEETLCSGRKAEATERRELEEHRTELATQRARLSSLREILDRHAYAAETVQRLLEKKANAAGVTAGGAAPTEFSSTGVLADFLDVEPEYERVVEEFLREELDYVVVKDWESAKRGIEVLRAEIPGRATFLLHDAVAAANPSNDTGSFPAGTVRSLASCVRFTNGFSSVPVSVLPKLERCYLVPDAEQGRLLAAQHPGFCFLTREGNWFQGALVSAGKQDSQGPLALKREFRVLTMEVEKQEVATARIVDALEQTVSRLEQQQAEMQRVTQEERECERNLMLAERDLREATGETERAAERVTLGTLERERLRAEAERSAEQLEKDRTAITEREAARAEMETETSDLADLMVQLSKAREVAQDLEGEQRGRLAALEERRRSAAGNVERLVQGIAELASRRRELERQCEQWRSNRVGLVEANPQLELQVTEAEERSGQLAARLAELQRIGDEHRQRVAELDQRLQSMRAEVEQARERKTEVEVHLTRLQSDLDYMLQTCRNELQVELETLAGEEIPVLEAEALLAAEENHRTLKKKLDNLGPINMMALEEFEECRERHEFLDRQRQDLLEAIQDTTQAIEQIDTICNQQFREALEEVGANFQQMFTRLFGGGQGMLRLMEAEDPNNAGIEIVAQPPGKRLQSVLLLSGGEKAMTAIALLLAIFRYKPSPFCVLDEVDAPLDDANIGRFTEIVQEMSADTQFILITHSKRTMGMASVLYGVTMQEPGVSKIVSVRFEAGKATTIPGSRLLAEAVA